MKKTRHAPPRASALLESMRGLGYTTGSALADIVDNSISAGATQVDIQFTWAGKDSWTSVLDNGHGMSDSELESAMRLGDKNPLVARETSDLGRFGMGLKTASLSQCRRFTVASLKDNTVSCLRWDLDALADTHDADWLLFEGPAEGSEHLLTTLAGNQQGTLVLWEKLDRIVTSGFTLDDFNDLIDRVEAHLAMVFHRLLEGTPPEFILKINGRRVCPWDPFLTGHPAKAWASPVARTFTSAGEISVECHVLPHKDRLNAKEYEIAAGPGGWNAQQGFYVYRNRRLLMAGGWLGLGTGKGWTREEYLRLARIRLDIPNTADADWKIDIRKSTARPPVALRPWLTRLAEETRERARKVFVHRGSPSAQPNDKPIEQAWRVEHLKDGMRYRIDLDHPAVASVLDRSGELLPAIKAMLSVIEATVPIQRIWLDTAEHKSPPKNRYDGVASAEIQEVLGTLFEDMVERRGMSEEAAKRMLMRTDPFQNYPSLVSALGKLGSSKQI
ncbi:ATP-binding protein [Comamonas kerstersii]|uniref:ATPase n=1 Tax=Comamonas kerstersii TaxID=225992 RepID=A0A0W7YTD1_9BURK|nr:ATP-binding protein [Comamonas kerstersii]KUF38366.1 ATPase [Comamonas kerstersii]